MLQKLHTDFFRVRLAEVVNANHFRGIVDITASEILTAIGTSQTQRARNLEPDSVKQVIRC